MTRSSGATDHDVRSAPVVLTRLTHVVAGRLAIVGLSLCLIVALTVLSIEVATAMPIPA